MLNDFLHLEQGFAYAAVSAKGGHNVYVTGRLCLTCADRACDPNNTWPVPCQWARAHAWNVVNNWGAGAYVQRIPIADLPLELQP